MSRGLTRLSDNTMKHLPGRHVTGDVNMGTRCVILIVALLTWVQDVSFFIVALLTWVQDVSFFLLEGNLPDYQIQRIHSCKLSLWQERHFHNFYHHLTGKFFDPNRWLSNVYQSP